MENAKRRTRWVVALGIGSAAILVAAAGVFVATAASLPDEPGKAVEISGVTVGDIPAPGPSVTPTPSTPAPSQSGAATVPNPTPVPADDHGGANGNSGKGGSGSSGGHGGGSDDG
jgi:hypothetical protein